MLLAICQRSSGGNEERATSISISPKAARPVVNSEGRPLSTSGRKSTYRMTGIPSGSWS